MPTKLTKILALNSILNVGKMFKVTKKQFMSFVVAVVMLSSTVGFLLSSGNNTNSPHSVGNVPDVPIPAQNQVTTLSYTASNVKATVQELFPNVILVGASKADNVSKVDADLQVIDGVISVSNSQFLQSQPGTTANFRTELRLTESGKINDVLDSLNEAGFLEDITIIPQALVVLPESVEFSNPSLEDTLEHTFSDPKAQAFVLFETRVGDEVLVSLEASFQGSTLIDLTAFEEVNLTSSPTFYFFEADFEISSFNNEFFVRTTSIYSDLEKLQGVKDSITESYENTIIVEPVSRELTINFKEPDKLFEQDLETFFESFEEAQSYNLQLDLGIATVAFGDADFASFKSSLETELNSLGFEVDSIEEPVVSLQGNVGADSKEDFLAVIKTIESENNFELQVLQQAVIETASVFVPDLNSTLSLPDGFFYSFISPSRTAGETINLSLLINASERLGIISIESQEAEQILS